MKVLLVTSSYKNAWPFLPELRSGLQKKGILVDVLDVTNLELITHEDYIIKGVFFRKLNVLKGGHRLIRFTAKNFIKKNLSKYDAINIHYLEFFYIHLCDTFLKYTDNLSFSIWGSDFYRASESQFLKFLPLFKKASFLSFGNIYTKRDFSKKIPQFDEKLKVASFGIGKFEKLRSCFLEKEAIKNAHKIDSDKIAVVCGYNASPAQRHLLLLQQIAGLPAEIKEKLVLVLPLTYGGDENYKMSVISAARSSGCIVKIFTGFLTDDEIMEIRVLGDVVLNAQVSDSFSASLQEHILCNAILVAGDWLPYKIMSDLGLKYFPVAEKQFGKTLEDIVLNFENYKSEVKNNGDILYNEGIWENRIQGWIDLYKGKK